MASGFKFPIRYKILAVLSVVVVAAVALYLYMAAKLFYEDKTELVYEVNQNNVRVLASEVRADLLRATDRLRLVAALALPGAGREETREAVFSQAFSQEDELVRVAVLVSRPGEAAPSRVFVRDWPNYLASYRKDAAYLDHLRELVPVPFERVLSEGIWVRNATLPEDNSPPLVTVAMAADTGGVETGKAVVYADIRLDRLLETVSAGGIARSAVVDSDGKVLASADVDRVRHAVDMTHEPLVQLAASSKLRSEVHRFDESGRSFLGSYDRVGLAGVIVVSRVETGEAFAAAERLIRKSIIYALLVVTAAFLVALFFSHHLTEPIQIMLEATQRVARGEFDGRVSVTSHDELAVLAGSFNTMTADLNASHEQIRQYSLELEQKVKDRTARLELQNVAIKEAQEALVRTTRLASVGEVAGRAAHEVLNPLTNVTARLEKMQTLSLKPDREDVALMAEIAGAWSNELKSGVQSLLHSFGKPSTAQPGKSMLEEDLGNLGAIASDLARRLKEREHDFEFLLREAARISKIVNGMRQLTRVSGNRGEIRLHALINEAVATMADVLGKNRIETVTKFGADDPVIMGDRDELIQVFSNLMRNSMHAIREGRDAGKPVGEPARIWFETIRHPGTEGPRVHVRLCDNGPGISPENFGRVFEATFTTKSVEDGTGLGLSISRRFIRALDGEIIVELSIPGTETAFLIDLPEFVRGGGAS